MTDLIQSVQQPTSWGDWMAQRLSSPVNLGPTCSFPLSPPPPRPTLRIMFPLCVVHHKELLFFFSVSYILLAIFSSGLMPVTLRKDFSENIRHWHLAVKIKSNKSGKPIYKYFAFNITYPIGLNVYYCRSKSIVAKLITLYRSISYHYVVINSFPLVFR
jgi:hypothetical protein